MSFINFLINSIFLLIEKNYYINIYLHIVIGELSILCYIIEVNILVLAILTFTNSCVLGKLIMVKKI